MMRQRATHVRGGPIVFLLPSSYVESWCGACAGEGGIERHAGGRRPARPTPCSRTLARVAERRGMKEAPPVSAIKPYEGFGDVDHTIKELMSF
jgi:hypothetical protein